MIDDTKSKIVPGPAHEIHNVQWTPIRQLITDNTLDGNKYLRTWISDIQSNVSKKSVHLFRSILLEEKGKGHPHKTEMETEMETERGTETETESEHKPRSMATHSGSGTSSMLETRVSA
jgi:hypothetical protein